MISFVRINEKNGRKGQVDAESKLEGGHCFILKYRGQVDTWVKLEGVSYNCPSAFFFFFFNKSLFVKMARHIYQLCTLYLIEFLDIVLYFLNI